MDMRDLSDFVIIFDLDGTLVDSAPDLAASMNAVLTAEGLPPVDPEEVRPLVGHGARALLKKGYDAHGGIFPEGAEGERLLAHFIDHYREHIAAGTTIYPGAIDTLSELATRGADLAVCTNKYEGLARRLLDELALTGFFPTIVGGDTRPTRKPAAEPLLHILARTGRRRGIMIGDTETDLQAARAAGMPCAIATFGFGQIDGPLRKGERHFDHYEALLTTIDAILSD
jgi:phosphoglycolate phosphatase